jgi:hypothetical protein
MNFIDNEFTLLIFSFLDVKNLVKCECVCNNWKKMIDSNDLLWKNLLEKKFNHEYHILSFDENNYIIIDWKQSFINIWKENKILLKVVSFLENVHIIKDNLTNYLKDNSLIFTQLSTIQNYEINNYLDFGKRFLICNQKTIPSKLRGYMPKVLIYIYNNPNDMFRSDIEKQYLIPILQRTNIHKYFINYQFLI